MLERGITAKREFRYTYCKEKFLLNVSWKTFQLTELF